MEYERFMTMKFINLVAIRISCGWNVSRLALEAGVKLMSFTVCPMKSILVWMCHNPFPGFFLGSPTFEKIWVPLLSMYELNFGVTTCYVLSPYLFLHKQLFH
jgi:hypothetical protein